jgi:hypothetical protein
VEIWLSTAKHGNSLKKPTLNEIFSDFWLEVSLKFSMNCFDLSSFFLLRDDGSPTAASLSSSRVLKTEPVSPITTGLDFAYTSDVTENKSRDPRHVVELSF